MLEMLVSELMMMMIKSGIRDFQGPRLLPSVAIAVGLVTTVVFALVTTVTSRLVRLVAAVAPWLRRLRLVRWDRHRGLGGHA